MRQPTSHTLLALVLCGASSAFGAVAYARDDPGHGQQASQQQRKAERQAAQQQKQDRKDQQREEQLQARAYQQQQRDERQAAAHPGRLPRQQQQKLIAQQRQRTADYSQRLRRDEVNGDRQELALQQQRRTSQLRFQQRYFDVLRGQALDLRTATRDYDRDPYFYTAPIYSYSNSGRSHEVNSYGAGMLRSAVSVGYQQGFGTGQADREDHWQSDPRSSYAYQNALYGFNGMYIDPDEYIYYFRQGFERGYGDGFDIRYQYGVRDRNSMAIITSILDQILDLTPLR
jgi:hypothetical protein